MPKKITLKYRLLILMLWMAGAEAFPQSEAGRQKEVYAAALQMRTEIYRLARNKLYEIFHPDFELISNDLADAISKTEEYAAVLEETDDPNAQEAVLMWNNLRLYSMQRLKKDEFVKYYYDTKTLDQILTIILEKLDEGPLAGMHDKQWEEFKKRQNLRTSVFKINIGYMTKKHDLSQSIAHILEKEIPVIETNTFEYARAQGYFAAPSTRAILKAILNDWLFLKENFFNVFYEADRTVFSVSNSMYVRIGWLDRLLNS